MYSINNSVNKLYMRTPFLPILKVLLLLYIIIVSNKLNNEFVNLFDNFYFRLLVLISIFYSVSIDFSLAILLSIAYLNSINTLNKIKMNDLLNVNSMDYLSSDDFNETR